MRHGCRNSAAGPSLLAPFVADEFTVAAQHLVIAFRTLFVVAIKAVQFAMNGRAVKRDKGAPRPTTASTMNEAIEVLGRPEDQSVIFGIEAPHMRAVLDDTIELLRAPDGHKVSRIDIAAHGFESVYYTALTALGEIPATYKSDLKLRALLRGEDPNSPELEAL